MQRSPIFHDRRSNGKLPGFAANTVGRFLLGFRCCNALMRSLSSFTPFKGELPLNTAVLFSMSLVLVFAVIALVRQMRLRRALESLLRRLLESWRTRKDD